MPNQEAKDRTTAAAHAQRLRTENFHLTHELWRRTREYHTILEMHAKLTETLHATLIQRDNLMDRVRQLEREALGLPGIPEELDAVSSQEVAS